MKYKVGDKVRTRGDLENFKIYGGQRYLTCMGFKGEVVTIKEVHSRFYKFEEDKEGYYWTDEMLESDEDKTENLINEIAVEYFKMVGRVEAYEKMLKIREENKDVNV